MEFKYRFNEQDYSVRLERQPDDTYLATIGERQIPVQVRRAADGQLNLVVDGESVHAYTASTRSPQTRADLRYVALVDRESCFFELERVTGSSRRASGGSASSGTLTAQMPGQVMDVAISEGDSVEEGDLILLLEAMKMEIRVTAPVSGIVARLHVAAGDQVDRGQTLAEVTPPDA